MGVLGVEDEECIVVCAVPRRVERGAELVQPDVAEEIGSSVVVAIATEEQAAVGDLDVGIGVGVY